MKKVFIFCAMAVGFMAFSACQKDNPDPASARDSIIMDDSSYLLANLVFTDEEGKLDGYRIGYSLNEANPGEISIPCESIENAQEIFKSWIPEISDSYENGQSVIWNMTDTLGRSQGQAVLVEGGEKGAVAHVELPKTFPLVTGINFLPHSAFPNNGEKQMFEGLDEYYFLNVVSYGGNQKHWHGSGKFVVLREYDEDTNTSGIIAFFRKEEYNMWEVMLPWSDIDFSDQKKAFRTVDEMRSVGWGAYRKYANEIDKVMQTISDGGVGGDEYACMDGSSTKKISFKNWEPSPLGAYHPSYRTCFVYFFTVVEKKGGGYELEFK